MPQPTTPRCPSAGHRLLQSRLREPRACCRIRLLLLGGAKVTWTRAGSPILLPDGSARSHQHSSTTDYSSCWGAGDGSDPPRAPWGHFFGDSTFCQAVRTPTPALLRPPALEVPLAQQRSPCLSFPSLAARLLPPSSRRRMLRGQRMINARHRKAEESEAGKCIPQAGRAGTARPEKQPQFLSAPAPSPAAEPAPAWPDPQPAPWGGCSWSQAPLHPWRSRSELLTPAGRALASTHLHKLCTSLPVGAT